MPYRQPARLATRYLRLCLDVLTTNAPCSVGWDAMGDVDGNEHTRRCPDCLQDVHDVALMDPVAAEAFLGDHVTETAARRPKLRLRLHRRPDGRVMASQCPRGVSERRQRRIASGVIALAALAVIVLLRLS